MRRLKHLVSRAAALSFTGTSASVDIPNTTSFQLTTGIALEAFVNCRLSRIRGAT
jgi:hypothetical protein